MASEIIRIEVIFEVDAQTYKPGRFTLPKDVRNILGLAEEQEVRLRILAQDDRELWSMVIRMQSGAEIDNSELSQFFEPGGRFRAAASRP